MKGIANGIAAIGVATFLGVMLCIGVTLGSYWRSLTAEAFIQWFTRNNGYVARSVPIAVAPALLGLVTSVVIDWGNSDGWLWLGSAACVVVVLALTGAYFVPTNRAFANGEVDVDDVPGRLRQWLGLHTVRIIVALGGAVLACIALQA